MARYAKTPARRRALRKAQAASARKRRGRGKGIRRAAKYVAAAGVIAGAAYVGKRHYQIDFATVNSRATFAGKSGQGIYGKGGRKHVWAARQVGGRYTGGVLSFGKQRAIRHR